MPLRLRQHQKPKQKAKGNAKKSAAKSKTGSIETASVGTSTKKRARGKETESNSASDGEEEKQSSHEQLNAVFDERYDECNERRAAYQALDNLLSGSKKSLNEENNTTIDKIDASSTGKQRMKQWLPCQAAYTGSQPGRQARYGILSQDTVEKIPPEILHLFNLDLENVIIKPTGNWQREIILLFGSSTCKGNALFTATTAGRTLQSGISCHTLISNQGIGARSIFKD